MVPVRLISCLAYGNVAFKLSYLAEIRTVHNVLDGRAAHTSFQATLMRRMAQVLSRMVTSTTSTSSQTNQQPATSALETLISETTNTNHLFRPSPLDGGPSTPLERPRRPLKEKKEPPTSTEPEEPVLPFQFLKKYTGHRNVR